MLGNSITLFSLEVFCSSETENEATASRQLDSLWSSKEVLIPIYSKGKIAEAFRAFKKIYWGGGLPARRPYWGNQIQRFVSPRR
jgi:hypothetical protein